MNTYRKATVSNRDNRNGQRMTVYSAANLRLKTAKDKTIATKPWYEARPLPALEWSRMRL